MQILIYKEILLTIAQVAFPKTNLRKMKKRLEEIAAIQVRYLKIYELFSFIGYGKAVTDRGIAVGGDKAMKARKKKIFSVSSHKVNFFLAFKSLEF